MPISYYLSQLRSILFIAPVMLLAIIIHECAHGWMSDRLGDPTPRNSGRLSLNPLKHLDPIGTLCLLFFHVGWAKPVPINPWYYKNRKKGIIAVSLAGPFSNFFLAFASVFGMGIVVKLCDNFSGWQWVLFQLLYYSAVINIGLALFNLIPIPPLDGSKVVGELFDKAEEWYVRLRKYWRFILLILLVTGMLSRPLSFLNDVVLESMWKLVKGMLHIGYSGTNAVISL